MCHTVSQHFADLPALEQKFHVDFEYKFEQAVPNDKIEAGAEKLIVIGYTTPVDDTPSQRFITTSDWGVRLNDNFIYNARLERLDTSPTWKYGATQKRLLVPVTGFWDQSAFVYRQNQVLALAGIAVRLPTGHTTVVVTRPATAQIAQIHQRMPVVVDEKYWDDWLNPSIPFADLRHVAYLAGEFEIARLRRSSDDHTQPNLFVHPESN